MIIFPSNDRYLPTAEELPDSDETPMDDQLQNDMPYLLKSLLESIWERREDWFFGINMGVYYNPDEPAIVPDGFLAVGVPRHIGEMGRLSYVLWVEKIPPILALEVIAANYHVEYEEKFEDYQALGILYYAIYNPLSGEEGRHKQRNRLEVYKLIDGKYKLLPNDSNRIWIPEIGLALGYERANHYGWQREWLYWYNDCGMRYPTYEEQILSAKAIAEQFLSAKQER
jgi:Uma2 family endonuclease